MRATRHAAAVLGDITPCIRALTATHSPCERRAGTPPCDVTSSRALTATYSPCERRAGTPPRSERAVGPPTSWASCHRVGYTRHRPTWRRWPTPSRRRACPWWCTPLGSSQPHVSPTANQSEDVRGGARPSDPNSSSRDPTMHPSSANFLVGNTKCTFYFLGW